MFINDIVKEFIHADDTNLYKVIVVDFPGSAAQILNCTWKDYEWAVPWLDNFL